MQGLLQGNVDEGPQPCRGPCCLRVEVGWEWRKVGSVYYPPNIREATTALPSPSALALESFEQPLIAQAPLPSSEASKGSSQASDQDQGDEAAKDKGKGKGKGKETKPPSEAKDVAVKAKEVEAKSKEADPKAKDAPVSQPSKKEDLSPPKAKAQYYDFISSFLSYFYFVVLLVYFFFYGGSLPLYVLYFPFIQ